MMIGLGLDYMNPVPLAINPDTGAVMLGRSAAQNANDLLTMAPQQAQTAEVVTAVATIGAIALLPAILGAMA